MNVVFTASVVSKGTRGIISGAIVCAAVFIGLGTMRCLLKREAARNVGNTGRNRQVMGTDESSAYQGDLPPSYSTGMPAESC